MMHVPLIPFGIHTPQLAAGSSIAKKPPQLSPALSTPPPRRPPYRNARNSAGIGSAGEAAVTLGVGEEQREERIPKQLRRFL